MIMTDDQSNTTTPTSRLSSTNILRDLGLSSRSLPQAASDGLSEGLQPSTPLTVEERRVRLMKSIEADLDLRYNCSDDPETFVFNLVVWMLHHYEPNTAVIRLRQAADKADLDFLFGPREGAFTWVEYAVYRMAKFKRNFVDRSRFPLIQVFEYYVRKHVPVAAMTRGKQTLTVKEVAYILKSITKKITDNRAGNYAQLARAYFVKPRQEGTRSGQDREQQRGPFEAHYKLATRRTLNNSKLGHIIRVLEEAKLLKVYRHFEGNKYESNIYKLGESNPLA